jgi:hypothetical protein
MRLGARHLACHLSCFLMRGQGEFRVGTHRVVLLGGLIYWEGADGEFQEGRCVIPSIILILFENICEP